MALFARIATTNDLPPLGERESPSLDFKARLGRIKGTTNVDQFELAKDIASMASVYGGVLLFGAVDGSELTAYVPMPEVEADEICEASQHAARDRCVPVPVVIAEKIPKDGGFVVAVNVFPVLDRAVAVWVTPIDTERFGSPSRAYVFPVRLSTHAIPYSPERLPMLMNPEIRRILILLDTIPQGDPRKYVEFRWIIQGNGITSFLHMQLELTGVSLDTNVLGVRTDASHGHREARVPLDDIKAVWEHSHARWSVRVSGRFDTGGNTGFAYMPGPD